MITVRAVTARDAETWLRFRVALWPDVAIESHRADMDRFLAGASREPLAVLLAEESGTPVGFAELSIRPYAEGCETDRVAFLEGWYVAPEARKRGIGAALVRSAEAWGRAQGCTEFGSDAEADNNESAAAHRALGFEEVGLIRCFRKTL